MQQWFVDFAERIDDGDPTYLACEECGQAALPPRTVCPECSSRTLEERSLSETATVTASTKIFSSIPEYADETPYIVVIATFDEGVRLTGQLRGAEGIEPGETVTVGVEEREDGWLVTFSPTD
ncbi:Zn-ribbon domain-containing OB-fold protein [Natrarchaeobaculum aegyptiacum]|uniref:Nucleic acid-binding protein n=1 Tax=Natrarchaeobaculum aegyptiacum TaxID=745377 RepID=A0A2Z2HUM1_9EURY|nr:OB-fold domain-containing protein [Natrarchaeobaculum aegyptiacum]ARS90996.1 nucleic acid-binding protein [Natrarchaeobaculum aegyptiacum]